MVAVFSGDTSGLFNSSFSALGNQGIHGQGNLGQSGESIFVNAATGNLVIQGQDQKLAALGVNFGTLRTYNSLGSVDDGNGTDNWRLGFLSTVTDNVSYVSRISADGAEQKFVFDAGKGLYVSTQGKGAHDTLKKENDKWIYTEGSSLVSMEYGTNGKLQTILDKNGKGQHFSYDSAGQLERVATDISTGQEISVFNLY